MERNGTLRVRVRVKFILFYSEAGPTDARFKMLRDFTSAENI